MIVVWCSSWADKSVVTSTLTAGILHPKTAVDGPRQESYQLSPDEFLVAGNGVAVTFERLDSSLAGIGSVDLIEVHGDHLTPIRRMNGDQSHQGRHLRIEVGAYQVQHIKLYKYGR